jgi:putative ABC transport system permease protein
MNRASNRKGVLAESRLLLRKIPWPIFFIFTMIALGIGANAGVFMLGSLVFPSLPYPHPEQLVAIRPEMQSGISAEDFVGLKQQTTAFQDLNASTARAFRLTTRAGSQDITAALVTTGFFQMMGDRFYLGYDFIPADGTADSGRVAILSHAMWKQLGSDKVGVGSTISLDKTPYTVVGVLAPGLRDRGAPVTVPLVFSPERSMWAQQPVNVIGRLRPGINIGEAQADIDRAVAGVVHRNLAVEAINRASLDNDRKFTLWLLLGFVEFVLLMESVSVVSLLRLRSDAALVRDWNTRRF